ncbi:hypothetical protein D187_008441 [Cystobacter fuscus DSM 2262]|uniref:Uncharacterized protein n=1 Tax=Cystobacter fuscus (strain ATCC 25194 / DSM 2262 / NBRC 100088 / M29) TaxID=1242864 RepID=S9QLV2_CYSF2|nr:hypothetical protein D187_008441 [Cystobacter fuscus DSM 2262]
MSPCHRELFQSHFMRGTEGAGTHSVLTVSVAMMLLTRR